jgi:hypothetical protein
LATFQKILGDFFSKSSGHPVYDAQNNDTPQNATQNDGILLDEKTPSKMTLSIMTSRHKNNSKRAFCSGYIMRNVIMMNAVVLRVVAPEKCLSVFCPISKWNKLES